MAAKGTVFNIQRFSIHDGPGVRTTVFLKGCPLSCLWCHNPEGISRQRQMIYRETRCNLCHDCIDACPTGALSLRDDAVRIDDESCSGCGRCEDVCSTEALEIAGKEMTVQQLMAEIERDRIFYDQSGGGVTFSGGEPLQQLDFILDLLQSSREREIHAALDTTGYTSTDVIERVAPLVDLFLFDLKVMDGGRHRAVTGVGNEPILRNLRLLAQDHRPVIVRIPVIPTINDDRENFLAVGEFVSSLPGQVRVDLLPYHGIAVEKYRRLRREYALSDLQPPSTENMNQIAHLLEGFGLAVTIGG